MEEVGLRLLQLCEESAMLKHSAGDVNTDTRIVINQESSDHSPTCLALLSMIEKDWLVTNPSELKEYLETLHNQGSITSTELKSLFALAMNKRKS